MLQTRAVYAITGFVPAPYSTGGGLHQIMLGAKLRDNPDFDHYERLTSIADSNDFYFLPWPPQCPMLSLDRMFSYASSTPLSDRCSLQVETQPSLNLIRVTSAAGAL
jgi:hypothetical protein